MADLDVEHGARRRPLTRRICLLLLASVLLAACGRKGDLYLPEGQAPASVPDPEDDRPERTDETDNLGDR